MDVKWILGSIFSVWGIIAVGFVVVIMFGVHMSANEHRRLMSQCMDDGKKEYECESMFKRTSGESYPMPIFIPVNK